MSQQTLNFIALLNGELTDIAKQFVEGRYNMNNVNQEQSIEFNRDLATLVSNRTQNIHDIVATHSDKDRQIFLHRLHKVLVDVYTKALQVQSTEKGKRLGFIYDYEKYLQAIDTLRFFVRRLELHYFTLEPENQSPRAKAVMHTKPNIVRLVCERALTRLHDMKENQSANPYISDMIKNTQNFLTKHLSTSLSIKNKNDQDEILFALLLFLKNKQIELRQIAPKFNPGRPQTGIFQSNITPAQMTIERLLIIINYEVDELTRNMSPDGIKRADEQLTRVHSALKK